jgi:hypothetical protein
MDLDYDAVHWQIDGTDLEPLYPPKALNYPPEPYVLEPYVYGFDNQFVGTLEAVPQPVAPTLHAVDSRDGKHAVLTLTGADPGTTNEIYVSVWGQLGIQDWRLVGTIVGTSGSITITKVQSLYACQVKSILVGNGYRYVLGNLFYVSDETNMTRVRIRDNVAGAAMRIAQRLGAQVTYQSPGRGAISLWAVLDNSDISMSMLGGEAGTLHLQIHLPRQSDWPPSDGLVPGARVGINGVWWAVDEIRFGTETIDLSAVFTLSLRRLDITVEVDGTDV